MLSVYHFIAYVLLLVLYPLSSGFLIKVLKGNCPHFEFVHIVIFWLRNGIKFLDLFLDIGIFWSRNGMELQCYKRRIILSKNRSTDTSHIIRLTVG